MGMLHSRTLVPPYSLLGDIGVVALGAAVTAVAAQITGPLPIVPFTLQTLAVMVCGMSLGARRGAASQVAYLMAGASGLPVFAEHAGGASYLFGQTGGYLWAFVLLAGFLGWCADRGWDRKPLTCIACLASAVTMTLLLGTAWLAVWIGLKPAFAAGFWPFIGAEALKCVLVALAVPGTRSLISKIPQG